MKCTVSMDQSTRQTAHLVGVCGAGMRALAEVLLDAGWSLTGSDVALSNCGVKNLIQRGLTFYQGHSTSNVTETPQKLIYSPAIPIENVERVEAVRRRIPCGGKWRWPGR